MKTSIIDRVCAWKGKVSRWAYAAAVLTPVGSWIVTDVFAPDPLNVLFLVIAVAVAVWRPRRQAWVRSHCDVRGASCA